MSDTPSLDWLAELEQIEVWPEVERVLSEHVRDRETGVFGRKEHGLGGALGIQDATVARGDLELRLPLIDLPRGSMSVLVGPNGAGKSTLLDSLMASASVELNLGDGRGTLVVAPARDLSRKRGRRTRFARLDQEELLSPVADLTAGEAMRQALKFFLSQFPVDDDAWADPAGYEINLANQEAQQRITAMGSSVYTLFGLEACAAVPVRQLSGGERTKLALLLVLMSDADVALFDEPTNHLDLVTIANLLGVFETYKRNGVTIVNVSHVDWFLKRVGTDRTLQIDGGEVMAFRSPYAKVGRHINASPTGVDVIAWSTDARSKAGLLLQGFERTTLPRSPLVEVDFPSLVSNEVRLLLGDNGSGKTTVLEHFAGARQTHNGNVAYLPQFWPADLVARRPTLEAFFHHVLDSTLPACDGHSRGVYKNRFVQRLGGTSLGGRQRPFLNLSGGEQRLAWFLAVSSLSAVDVLMADEPTNHMDGAMRQVVTRGLVDFAATRGAVMISTHDLELIEDLEADSAVSLNPLLFVKRDGATTIERFTGASIGAHMRARIEAAKVRGRRAV